MVKIEGSDITLTKGDTLIVVLTLKKNGESFIPETGSTIRFAMKQRYSDPDETALVKNIPIDTLTLELEPEDTKNLTAKKNMYMIFNLQNPTEE